MTPTEEELDRKILETAKEFARLDLALLEPNAANDTFIKRDAAKARLIALATQERAA